MLRRLISLGLMLCVMGCSNSSDKAAAPSGAGGSSAKTYKIAVIPKGTSHEFWKSVHAGAQQAADEIGGVEILWKGPLLENDRDGEITVVQDFITKRVDGICLAPLDSQALGPVVAQAKEAGIPTVIFDSGLDDQSNIVSYVATDNLKGGVLAAQQMGKLLGGKGNVIMLRYTTGSESTALREDGFLSALQKEFPDIKVLSSDQFAGVTQEDSLKNALDVLNKYKD